MEWKRKDGNQIKINANAGENNIMQTLNSQSS